MLAVEIRILDRGWKDLGLENPNTEHQIKESEWIDCQLHPNEKVWVSSVWQGTRHQGLCLPVHRDWHIPTASSGHPGMSDHKKILSVSPGAERSDIIHSCLFPVSKLKWLTEKRKASVNGDLWDSKGQKRIWQICFKGKRRSTRLHSPCNHSSLFSEVILLRRVAEQDSWVYYSGEKGKRMTKKKSTYSC